MLVDYGMVRDSTPVCITPGVYMLAFPGDPVLHHPEEFGIATKTSKRVIPWPDPPPPRLVIE